VTRTLAAMATLQVADVLTTWAGLNAGAVELNPYPAALIASGGIAELAVVKAFAFFGVAWLVAVSPAWSLGVWRWTLQLACVPLALVAVSNLGVALR